MYVFKNYISSPSLFFPLINHLRLSTLDIFIGYYKVNIDKESK